MTTPKRRRTYKPAIADKVSAGLAAWIAEHPTPPLTEHEQRVMERAFDVPDHMQMRKTWLRDFGEDF